MKTLLLTAILAVTLSGAAMAQTVRPPNMPPAPGKPTENLILDAMLATARAASVNPNAAQSAQVNTNAAIQRYNTGDINGARAAAIQALIEANRLPQTQIPVLQSTIPQTSYLKTQPFLIPGGSVAAIDADAFVAQARGAVAACTELHSANTGAAAQHLNNAIGDEKAGRYQDVRTEARTAVDLCAASQAQLNRR